MKQLWTRALLATVMAFAPLVVGAATYDESVGGDLSSTPATPTPWTLENGANVLKGSVTGSTDYDIVSFTVPAGHRLDTLFLDQYQIQGYQSFLGLQSGSTWTAGLGWMVSGPALIGHDLFSIGDVGTNRLERISENGNMTSPQFTPPLQSGTYTMLLQDTASAFQYQYTFNVSPVPEPGTIALAAVGLMGVCRLARRR